jgi:hypothetical protein
MNTDEEQLRELWAKGHKAWAGVPNATEWVEKLRGRTEDTPPVAALPPNADITEARARAAHPERMWPVLHAVEGTAERPSGWWESWPALWASMALLLLIAGAMLAKC